MVLEWMVAVLQLQFVAVVEIADWAADALLFVVAAVLFVVLVAVDVVVVQECAIS